jgi:hypothetical protein
MTIFAAQKIHEAEVHIAAIDRELADIDAVLPHARGPNRRQVWELTVARKRQELARVIERLRSPGLTSGLARELCKNVASLEREIAELEQVCASLKW